MSKLKEIDDKCVAASLPSYSTLLETVQLCAKALRYSAPLAQHYVEPRERHAEALNKCESILAVCIL